MSRTATRASFLLSGGIGALLVLAVTLAFYYTLPSLETFSLLSPERTGTEVPATLVLLGLGLVATAELPLGLYGLIRLARSAPNVLLLYATHFAYVSFPALYGVLGAVLTGERWWLWMMALLAGLRFVTSALAIYPQRYAVRSTARREVSSGPDPHSSARPAQAHASPVPTRTLAPIKGFVLDMDGVLYRGMEVREGAIPFVEYLNHEQIPYVCLTNNASRTSEMYEAKLQALGLPIDASRVLGAARATAEWLAEHAPRGSRVLVVGEEGLRQELSLEGFVLVEQAPADYVVVGIDFSVTYERLKQAMRAIRGNARFIGTNPDPTFPSEDGLSPGNGATLAFLETATGVKPIIIGKPSVAVMEVALEHLGLPASEVAMVGDRLDTDILGGQNAGMVTILLRGGVTSPAELAASSVNPDFIFDDLAELLSLYQVARAEHR